MKFFLKKKEGKLKISNLFPCQHLQALIPATIRHMDMWLVKITAIHLEYGSIYIFYSKWTYGNIKRWRSVNILNTGLSLEKRTEKNPSITTGRRMKIQNVFSPFGTQCHFIQPLSYSSLTFKLQINITRIFWWCSNLMWHPQMNTEVISPVCFPVIYQFHPFFLLFNFNTWPEWSLVCKTTHILELIKMHKV